MQWYYSVDGQQQGPVSQADLEALARTGAVGPETLVWRDGLANWTAYSAAVGVSAASPVPPGAGVPTGRQERCAECGQTFATEDMVKFEKVYVCANCKPLFFQKIREGVPVGAAMWRYKKQLVTRLNPVLPARCLKCNVPTEDPQKKRNLYWHPPLVYLALLFNVIVYVIIAVIVRKRSTAMVSICREHRVKRRNVILASWLMVLVGLGSIIGGAVNESGWVMGTGAILFLGGIIYGIAKGRLVYAAKMDKERIWLAGCGKDFLADFPEWTGA